MNTAALVSIVGAITALVGALVGAFVQSRRLPSDIRLIDAQAEKTQHEAGQLVIKSLSDEVDRLKKKLTDFEERLTKAETRATGAETRLAESESRAAEFRRAVIALGERLDQERMKARDMAVNLCGIIEHLLDCIENPSKAAEVDRPAIARLIQGILNGYPAEQFVRV